MVWLTCDGNAMPVTNKKNEKKKIKMKQNFRGKMDENLRTYVLIMQIPCIVYYLRLFFFSYFKFSKCFSTWGHTNSLFCAFMQSFFPRKASERATKHALGWWKRDFIFFSLKCKHLMSSINLIEIFKIIRCCWRGIIKLYFRGKRQCNW